MKHKKFERTHSAKPRIKKRRLRKQRYTVSVQAVVDAVFRNRGWAEKLYERNVFDLWESIVGKEIAAHSVPVSLSRGILRVEVAHQVYANELSLLKTDYLEKLESKLEELKLRRRRAVSKTKIIDIQFRFNPRITKYTKQRNGDNGTISNTIKPLPHNISDDAKSIPPEMIQRIDAAVSQVNDCDLRDALKSLFFTQYNDTEPID